MFDILIWLIVAFFIFGFDGGKKKAQKRQSQKAELPPRQAEEVKPRRAKKSVTVFGDLGEFVQEFMELMSDDDGEEKPKPQTELTEKKRYRRLPADVTPRPADECDYCTGEAEVNSVFAEHSAPMKPLVISDKRPSRDVATACRELQLNQVQQAVVWAEILDKPLALRHKR